MGKLKELWGELRETNNPTRKKDIQKKINSIEKWMIDNKIGTIKTVTDWSKRKISGGSFMGEINHRDRFKDPMYPWHTAYLWVEDRWMVGRHNEDGIDYNLDGTEYINKSNE